MTRSIDDFRIIKRNFYNKSPEIVARELLGKYLIRTFKKEKLIGRIVETEAYLPFIDPAAHSFRGIKERNKSTFGPPGHAYVHASRHHFLMDVVTLGIGVPGSVLLRAIEPIAGTDQMKINRNSEKISNLTSGPGKLCQAFGITILDDGKDVASIKSNLLIMEKLGTDQNFEVTVGKRIGISKAKDLLLRYYIKNNPFVSVKSY